MKNSIIIKMIAVGFMTVLLLIPTAMIRELVNERQNTRDQAIDEVSSKWSREQTIIGPVLSIPYKELITAEDKKIVEKISYAHFLPEDLNIAGDVSPEILRRGIFETVAYKSKIKFNGKFIQPNFDNLDIAKENILWKDAVVSISISDMRGINEDIKINWDNKNFPVSPGVGGTLNVNQGLGDEIKRKIGDGPAVTSPIYPDINTNSGVNARISINEATNAKKDYSYSYELSLNGSKMLYFAPIGSKTNVELKSPWQNPSFDGAFLPDEREVNDKGFSAKWKILELNRNIPKSWVGSNLIDTGNSAFGVKFLAGVDEYQKSMRAIKYAIMTIALTFLIFFFVEVINKIRIHPIQYILVGLALILFYSLLLSLSEHMNFNFAYVTAGIITILMIGAYSRTIFKNNFLTILQSSILIIIYGFIYTILQLQDFALLMGSIGLFIVLAIVMYISRKIDWYSFGLNK